MTQTLLAMPGDDETPAPSDPYAALLDRLYDELAAVKAFDARYVATHGALPTYDPTTSHASFTKICDRLWGRDARLASRGPRKAS